METQQWEPFLLFSYVFCGQRYKTMEVLKIKLLYLVFLLTRTHRCQECKMYLRLRANFSVFLYILYKSWFFGLILIKVFNIKFHENLCSGSRVVTAGRWTDMQT
jgi:hypothetical protein